MRRGEICYADLNPSVGSEANKKRPVLIISNDANNKASATITVLPISSNIDRIYPFEVALDAENAGLPKDSKIQCQQIRTISKLRVSRTVVGKVDKEILHQIDAALKLHLNLS